MMVKKFPIKGSACLIDTKHVDNKIILHMLVLNQNETDMVSLDEKQQAYNLQRLNTYVQIFVDRKLTLVSLSTYVKKTNSHSPKKYNSSDM